MESEEESEEEGEEGFCLRTSWGSSSSPESSSSRKRSRGVRVGFEKWVDIVVVVGEWRLWMGV